MTFSMSQFGIYFALPCFLLFWWIKNRSLKWFVWKTLTPHPLPTHLVYLKNNYCLIQLLKHTLGVSGSLHVDLKKIVHKSECLFYCLHNSFLFLNLLNTLNHDIFHVDSHKHKFLSKYLSGNIPKTFQILLFLLLPNN